MNAGPIEDRACCRWLVVIAALAVLLWAGRVEADAVDPPPEDCPRGSIGTESHCGPHCRPRRCSDASDCEEPMTCEDLDLCISILQCMSGYGEFTSEAVTGSCEDGEACESGECETVAVCAAPEPVGVARRAGCECGVARMGLDGWVVVVFPLLALALLGLRRRR